MLEEKRVSVPITAMYFYHFVIKAKTIGIHNQRQKGATVEMGTQGIICL